MTLGAIGLGIATNYADSIISTWFSQLKLVDDLTVPSSKAPYLNQSLEQGVKSPAEMFGLKRSRIIVEIPDLNGAIADVPDAYLRLHLLSHGLVKPNSINLEGIFGILPNNIWSNIGALPNHLASDIQHYYQRSGESFVIFGVDKFPRMLDFVVPAGVRIADGDRVRLGAHLAAGTTVMHEGFVNFNAGTLGPAMIEGRISAGVTVGANSDIGGGASIMGTLSGGGSIRISVGEKCLIGANAGIGISLGDNCVVESGLYITTGTKLRAPDNSIQKASELSGLPNIRYWRNSLTGEIQAVMRSGASWGGLNEHLHGNN